MLRYIFALACLFGILEASIEDVIQAESEMIIQLENCGRVLEARDCYVDRAESYLLNDETQKSWDDYEYAYQMSCLLDPDNKSISFRILLGRAILEGSNGHDVTPYINELQLILADTSCEDCRGRSFPFSANSMYATNREPNKEKEVPIQGPDRMNKNWCKSAVKNTAIACRSIVAAKIKDVGGLSMIGMLIDDLEKRGSSCCETNEFWKQCVQPLAKKLINWDGGYFPELPDPLWD